LLKRDSRFLLDNNLIIAAIKSGWTRSTDLLFTMMLSDAMLLVDKELLFEYEKYIQRILGLRHLFILINNRSYLVDPSNESLLACKPFFPQSQYADAAHAATCLEASAILITNDAHFKEIKKSGLIEVWSISEAIRRIL
jgi:hypothetical protein